MEAHQHHPGKEEGEETALLLVNPPEPSLSLIPQSTHSDESHVAPRQKYAYIAAQGSSRIHAGNSYVEQQNNYYGPEAALGNSGNPDTTIMSLKTALAFPEMSLRSANVATAQEHTCDWIFETPEYKRWLDSAFRPAHHGILWIKGKPGAGKSTIMKHILRVSQKRDGTGKFVSFFFNARGQGLVRSTEGMYRALLCRIIDNVPSLQDMFDPNLVPIFKEKGWPLELLKDLFREAVRQYRYEESLTCCVDALDECDEEEIRNMIALFEDIGEMAASEELPFSVCFTSRHYPKITIAHVEEIEIDDLHGHQNDISEYVQRRLRLLELQNKLREQLVTEIRRRSSGVFLWVVLVVGLLNKTKDQGNVHLLHGRLREIPPDLHDLFDEILGRDKSDANFLPTMQWMLYAGRELTGPQLYFAVMISTDSLTEATIRWDTNLVNERVMGDFITASSKGFLEYRVFPAQCIESDLRGEPPMRYPERHIVQFIHESVREFFLGYGLQRLSVLLGNAVAEAKDNIRQRLERWCVSYMELCLAQHLSSTNRLSVPSSGSVLTGGAGSLEANPFLEYSLADGLNHSSELSIADRLRERSSFYPFMRSHGYAVFRLDDNLQEGLHKNMVHALRSLIQRAPALPSVAYGRKTPDEVSHQSTWDAYHVSRLRILQVLLAGHDARRFQQCRCADSLQTLVHHRRQRHIWSIEPCQIADRLVAALQTEDELVTHVAVATIAHRGTFADMPLARIYNSIQISSEAKCRFGDLLRETTDLFAQEEFSTREYKNEVKTALRHYQMSGEGQLYRLLLELRQIVTHPSSVDRDRKKR